MLSAALAAGAAHAASETKPAPLAQRSRTTTSAPPKSPVPTPASAKGSVRIFKSDMNPALPVPKGPLDVSVATSEGFSRLEFRWNGAVAFATRREGRNLILVFNRYAEADIARLRVSPPPHIENAEIRRASGGGMELVLALVEGAEFKAGRADGAIYVNVYAPPDAEKPGAGRPNPVPASGVVVVEPALKGGELQLTFPFAAPVGAAVFRRGDAVWVVFDAEVRFDLSEAPRHLRQASEYQVVPGRGFTAIRIKSADDVHPSASAQAGVWTIGLGRKRQPFTPVAVDTDRDAGPAALSVALAGSTAVRWLNDPVVGDRLGVVTALGPAKGLAARRATIETILPPTVHGLVVQPLTEDIAVDADGDLVRIFRPRGLALSGDHAAKPVKAAVELPLAAASPAVIDPAWTKLGKHTFLHRYDELQAAAAEEGGKQAAGHAARYGLARFLIASGMLHEGLGVLDMMRRGEEGIAEDPEFRGLRGAARVLVGRLKEAEADFAAPVLLEDPSSALWRGYIAWKQGDMLHAREQLAQGASAMGQFSPAHRARFARAIAESAVAAGDLAQAAATLKIARGWKLPPEESLGLSLAQAKVSEAQGNWAAALKIYEIVAKTGYGSLAADAELHATQIKLAHNKIDALAAVKSFEALRWRWRGDTTELEIIRALGNLYLAQGRYREALGVMRTAGSSLPSSPVSVALHNETTNAFRQLFLDGGADGLQPVQALALFYDFKELTPVGGDGDMMIRKLAQRLVAVDLLDHAAELLDHQSKERLDGVARAQVATDLALIYLMDRKPEAALTAIAESRTTVLPSALNLERRVIEARALMQIGRLEHALEVIGRDPSPDALAVRAEVYWKQGAWPLAGAALEQSLAGRGGAPMTAGEEARLLKAAVAYSLAGNEAALTRLRARFDGQIAQARAPDALRVALYGVDDDKLTAADLTRAVSEADAFAGWVGEMKRRFRAKPLTTAAASKPSAEPKPAAA